MEGGEAGVPRRPEQVDDQENDEKVRPAEAAKGRSKGSFRKT